MGLFPESFDWHATGVSLNASEAYCGTVDL